MERNRFHIDVRCRHGVTDAEWLDLLMAINTFLQEFRNGKYSNVGAFLEENVLDD